MIGDVTVAKHNLDFTLRLTSRDDRAVSSTMPPPQRGPIALFHSMTSTLRFWQVIHGRIESIMAFNILHLYVLRRSDQGRLALIHKKSRVRRTEDTCSAYCVLTP